MKIFINLETLDESVQLRRKNDGTFRLFQDYDEEDDFLGSNMQDIEKITIPTRLTFNNIEYKINSSDSYELNFNDFDKNLYLKYYTYLDNRDFAMVPNLKQLKNCISSGVDELGNRLVLTVFGNFILKNDFMKISKPFVVLNNEYSVANNGYIGLEAARDDYYMKNLLAMGLVHYIKFLETGKVSSFCDVFDTTEEIQSNQKIVEAKLKAIKFNN